MSVFKQLGLIVKQPAQQHEETLNALVELLNEQAVPFVFDHSALDFAETKGFECVSREELTRTCDLAIVVGGDGTLLNAARSLVNDDVAVVGINLGRLGFLVDVSPEEMAVQLNQILQGDFIEEPRSLLRAQILRNDEEIGTFHALNDVTLHVRDVVRMIEFETSINGHYVNTQRADGLVVATPTGSTAYALSGGGPILHPNMEALTLVPICPHTLSNRPLVVSGDSEISIRMCGQSRNTGQVAFDGQDNVDLRVEDRIVVTQHPNRLRLIHPPGYDYFHILRAKLRWSEQP